MANQEEANTPAMAKATGKLQSIEVNFGSIPGDRTIQMLSMDDVEEEYDALNDETFGGPEAADIHEPDHDWEEEHEKLACIIKPNSEHNHSKALPSMDNSIRGLNNSLNTFPELDQLNENMRFNADQLLQQSLSHLGLDDDLKQLGDPAIMTMGWKSSHDENQSRLNSIETPTYQDRTIFYSSENNSFSNSSSIWGDMADYDRNNLSNNSKEKQHALSPSPAPRIKTLQEVEDDLLNKNAIKRPILLEDLEASFLNSTQDSNPVQSMYLLDGWSPFGGGGLQNILPNGETTNKVQLQQKANMLPMGSEVKTVEDLENEMLRPQHHAQTLSEIEHQLLNKSHPISIKDVAKNSFTKDRHNNDLITPIRPKTQYHQPQILRPQIPPNNANTKVSNVITRPFLPPNIGSIPPPGLFPQHLASPRWPGLIHRPPPPPPPGLQPRPLNFLPPGPPGMPVFPPGHPLHMLQQQQQQQQLIMLAQQQKLQQNSHQNKAFIHVKNIQHQARHHGGYDEYRGLMTPRERSWLITIQMRQLEFEDPYKEDYYYVTFTSRKIAAAASKAAATNKELINENTPCLVLPERAKPNSESNGACTLAGGNYVPRQFDQTLGKIQVSNVKNPRKLIDYEMAKQGSVESSIPDYLNSSQICRTELRKYRKLLLEIENLYAVLLNIDDEDKRMGALPLEAKKPHIEMRAHLCDKLFQGITNEANDGLNLEMTKIRKGCALIFRALTVLTQPQQKAIILSKILDIDNFHLIVMQKDQTLYGLDYGQIIADALKTVEN